jgi:hypothetical protein
LKIKADSKQYFLSFRQDGWSKSASLDPALINAAYVGPDERKGFINFSSIFDYVFFRL